MELQALLIAFIAWIGAHTTYDVSQVKFPHIETHTQQAINWIYYGDTKCLSKRPNIVAVYTPKNGGTEYLNKKFDIRNLENQSTLLHETFHHVQYANRDKMPKTEMEMEEEALSFENTWRAEHGLSRINRRISDALCL